MIVDKLVSVKIINHNQQHYIDLGFNVKYGDVIDVDPHLLSLGAHVRVNTECDVCGTSGNTKFQDYVKVTKNFSREYYCRYCTKELRSKLTLIDKYGVDNPSKSENIKQKKKETNLKNWGVENVFQNEEIKEKSKKTLITKYGVDHINRSEKFKEKSKQTRIEKGWQIPDEKLTDYQLYRRKVINETRKYLDNLFDNWNGFDYYDNEYIKENKNLDSNDTNYPTIDHKISVYNGFLNNIDYKIVGNIDNLCITKRGNNSSKQSKNENDFFIYKEK